MRVVVWGINYAPEVTGIAPCNTALCEYLQEKGHDVEMVTTFSYYPQWKKRDEDQWQVYRTDIIRGVRVHRCWHYVPAKVSSLKRILHELSFVKTSFLRALLLKKADVYVVVSPPLLLGAAAWLLTKLKGSRYHFHVQDLQPDAAVGLNMLKPGLFTKLLYGLEAIAYRHASCVSGIGQGMMDAFTKKGVPATKMALLPNGFDVARAGEPSPVNFREIYHFSTDDFLAVYSGNLGMKQGLEILPGTAALLTNSKIKLVICGYGARRAFLEEQIRIKNLTNMRLLPLLADEDYRGMLQTADVCLITQQAGSGNAFLPSKLLPTLAHRRAVVSVADEDSALACAVREGGFGKNIPPESPAILAETLVEFAENHGRLSEFQVNGFAYVARFDHSRVLADFERVLSQQTTAPVF